MAFLRKTTRDGISMGVVYSIIQKCIRRCMISESLYYARLIFEDGTPNALRKRLIQCCLEDMCNWNLAKEIHKAKDSELMDYVIIVSKNKKTHISAYAQRVALDYVIKNLSIDNNDKEMKELMMFTKLQLEEEYKEIRKKIDYPVLYTYMGKSNLVWSVFTLWKYRKELRYQIDKEITEEDRIEKKFDEIPFWVYDKHTPNGTKGYEFFFKYSLIMNNKVYNSTSEEDYEIECKKIYRETEKKYGIKSKTKNTIERYKKGEIEMEEVEDPIPEFLKGRFKDIIQIQLLTRRSNPKVYFVTDINPQKVNKYVIKGVMNKEFVKSVIRTEKLKKKLNEPHLHFETICEDEDKYWCLFKSVVDYNCNEYVMKESKLESMRPIYNGVNANCNFEELIKDKEMFYELIVRTMFKALIGANDWAQRNYIIDSNNVIYSIDDHVNKGSDVTIDSLTPKLKRTVKEEWERMIKENRNVLIEKVEEWKSMLKTEYFKTRCDMIKILL